MRDEISISMRERLKRAPAVTAAAKMMSMSRHDRRRLARALPLVLFVRAALFIMPFTRLHSLLTRLPPSEGELSTSEVERLSWAVGATARTVPGATCLTQALALQALLRYGGESSSIQVGFLRQVSGEVKGHAWVEWRNQVVIGGQSATGFTGLLTLKG